MLWASTFAAVWFCPIFLFRMNPAFPSPPGLRRLKRRLFQFLSLVALLGSVHAGVLVSESFNYTTGTVLNGKNGGTGFTSGWVESGVTSDYDLLQTGSPTFGELFTAGNSVASKAPHSMYTDLSRSLTHIAGTAGKVVWVSCLLRKESTVTSSQGDYFGLVLYSTNGSVFLGKPSESNTWVVSTAGTAAVAGEDSGSAVTQSTTALLVAKISFVAGNETIQLFVDPAPGTTEPTVASASKTNVDLDKFVALGVLGGEAAWSFDEIRLGTTFADVANRETVKPLVTVTSPVNASSTTNASLQVTGTASDNVGVASVLVQRGSGGTFDPFQTATGTTDWSQSVTLTPGLNAIQVKAVDVNGNESVLVSRTVTYVLMSPLTVDVSPAAGGSVTAGFLGTHDRQVSHTYKVTATPALGYVFDGWTGDAVSESAALTFVMQENMHLQANFILNPFVPVKGVYTGLVRSSSPSAASTGYFRVSMLGTGSFTGSFVLGGVTFPIAGVFDNDGVARFGTARTTTKTILRTGLPSLTVGLQVDLSGGTDSLTGTVTEANGFTSNIAANRQLYTVANPVPAILVGRYTVLLPANAASAGPGIPSADGWATMTVAKTGGVRVTGMLADGTPLLITGILSKDNVLPFYTPLYLRKGALAGQVSLAALSAPDRDAEGLALDWFRPPNQLAVRYKAGWPNGIKLDLIGSHYTAPSVTAGIRVLPNLTDPDADGNAGVVISGADLAADIPVSLNISPAGGVTIVNRGAEKLAFTIAVSTGTFYGSFVPAVGKAAIAFRGVVFQKQDRGAGLFLGATESGAVKLSLQ
jgi:uncharacterized repeat protein (TIGR02543 family)